jgi:ERCC4-type nuclease
MAIIRKPAAVASTVRAVPSAKSAPVAEPGIASVSPVAGAAPQRAVRKVASKTLKPAKSPKPRKQRPKLTDLTWKPTALLPGFVLVVDTNEQRPLFLERQPDLIVHRHELITGDYAIKGYEEMACVERKMLSDFDAFMGKERERKTIPKLERMREMVWSALVIEASELDVFGPRRHGRMTGEHARGFLKKCRVQYGIHVFISTERAELERYILDHLAYVYAGLAR